MRVIEFLGYIETGKKPHWQELELDIEASVHEAEEHCDSTVQIEGVWLRDTKHSVLDLVTDDDRERWIEEALERCAEEQSEERGAYRRPAQTWRNRP